MVDMTVEQEIFYKFFLQVFEDHGQDILGTVTWIATHMPKFKRDYSREYLAFKALTTRQINQVIYETLLPF